MKRNPIIENRIKREKEKRVEDILRAAQQVILLKNYAGATMDDIAAEAGITKPTIYQYFKTKDELFVRMMEPLLITLADKLHEIHESLAEKRYESGKDIVHDVFNVYYSTFEENPDMFILFNIFLQTGILIQLNADSSTRLKELGKKSFTEGNMIIRLAIDQGLFIDTNIIHATDLTWATFWGIVQVEQSKWKKEGISGYINPVMKLAETNFIKSIVKR